ncbi:hypothetical protein TBLA_0G02330 [Henningerozyma blattae CBS 6284]|uniref:Uncharacterized protein n=1 Tax=Henningerozyma blattae (strain ATCC 34711 / CBS 6284 / DSM 70876 / NBRC 10599 / NRRL Y-10934 / UCD 77-7) TaxID=1071380 RepID=I2H721_HENB6|nr:hypothetical protein TBLA_0G02330 [Tetrapisispora blattae CBS 6284]CCH62173.1 hypothetical protein TBLA_0G02330 [Tetrapisispora blattae CBS 6284]
MTNSNSIRKNIKACLFDMDGLLLNTEDIYTITANEALKKYGKGPFTWDVKMRMQGLPGPEAGAVAVKHYDLPCTVQEYMDLNAQLQNDYWGKSAFLPGAKELIQYLKSKNIPIALCTSSDKSKLNKKTDHLKDVFELFDVIVTGDDSRIPKGKGKPFPDVWIAGLAELNEKFNTSITSDECLVFEDGKIGVTSGMSFGAFVIWVPHPESYGVLGDTDAFLNGKGELVKSLELFDATQFGL